MKKRVSLLILLIAGISTLISCKKYEKCCFSTGYDKLNDTTWVYKDCQSDLSKKEYESFEDNNYAQKSYENMRKAPTRYSNMTYSCK